MGFFAKLKEKFSKKDKTIETYDSGLKESRKAFTNRINKLAKKYSKINEEFFEELEEILISSDCGISYSYKIIGELTDKVKKEKVSNPEEITEILFDTILEDYVSTSTDEKSNEIKFYEDRPTLILIVGVNGVGKTTSIAKLANRYIKEGKKTLLIAADTFRAGAKEQLTYRSEKVNSDVVSSKKEGSDPSSVIYDGLEKAKKENYDLIIIDTAGRLQNKSNLMAELTKMNKVISKEGFILDETLLVLVLHSHILIKSPVMVPSSIVLMAMLSTLAANSANSGIRSSSPRFFRAPVQANNVAIGIVDVSSPLR